MIELSFSLSFYQFKDIAFSNENLIKMSFFQFKFDQIEAAFK